MLVRVSLGGLLLKAEDFPEGFSLAALLDHFVAGLRFLVAGQVADVQLCCIQIGLPISREEFATDPDVGRLLSLDHSHAARIKTEESLTALVKILRQQLAYDALRIGLLMTHEHKDARVHGQSAEIAIL